MSNRSFCAGVLLLFLLVGAALVILYRLDPVRRAEDAAAYGMGTQSRAQDATEIMALLITPLPALANEVQVDPNWPGKFAGGMMLLVVVLGAGAAMVGVQRGRSK